MKYLHLPKKRKIKIISIIGILIALLCGMWMLSRDAERKYSHLISSVMYDRNGIPLSVKENSKGHYVLQTTSLPVVFEKKLIQKEDRFFYVHFGLNPVSTIRAIFKRITSNELEGSSTLTQQLAKNILGTETKRTLKNKIIELFYAVSMELFLTKEEILTMYANTVYMGNQLQGFETASSAYFDKPLDELTHSERISLLATLSHPSTRNPWKEANAEYADSLNESITPEKTFSPPITTEQYSFQKDAFFELRTAEVACKQSCVTTIDNEITESIRDILKRHIEQGRVRNIKNGAVVVIDAHTSELLSLIGTRDPNSRLGGDQINMALEPRPIGSTIKPFIYAKGFEQGLRPYSLVDDREYKYPIDTGYSLYPKNYDGQYRGIITLHEALSNSLNVPSVKVLEYIGLNTFYLLLRDTLSFLPIQDLDEYEYGIALGGLEMDLLTLTHYFTLLPQKGVIVPLRILAQHGENFNLPPQSHITEPTTVFPEEYVELVHAILSDRLTGVNQFGLKGNLNLTYPQYGVKTGTSRDFHDSWVVGYTPDFVVGVWLGNTENTPLQQISGTSGAGGVWHDVMEYLLQTDYHKESPFVYEHITQFEIERQNEWALKSDSVEEHRDLLLEDTLILSIHDGDAYEYFDKLSIPLKARGEVMWSINGEALTTAKETVFRPQAVGTYKITAWDPLKDVRESVTITVTQKE